MKLLSLVLLAPALSFAMEIPEFLDDPTTLTPGAGRCAPELLQQCAKDICGIPGKVPSVYSDESMQGYVPDAQAKAEIDRAMSFITRVSLDWKLLAAPSLTNFKKYLESSKQNFEPGSIPGIWQLLNRYVGYRVEGEKIVVVPIIPNDADPGLKKGIESWAQSRTKEVQSDPGIRMRLGLSSPKESMDAYKERIEEMKKKIELMPETPLKASLVKSFTDMAGAMNVDYPNEMQVFALANYFDWLRVSVQPVDPTKKVTENPYFPSCKEDCIEGLRPLLTSSAFLKRIEASLKRVNEDRQDYLDRCEAGLLLRSKYGKLPGQQEKAIKVARSALDKVLAGKFWSEQTKKSFGAFMDKEVKVAADYSSKEFMAEPFGVNTMTQARMDFTPFGVFGTLLKMENTSDNIYDINIPLCPSPTHTGQDSFGYGVTQPVLHVSPYSCEHQGHGEGNLAHEIGHALTSYMLAHSGKSPESFKNYRDIRDCVNSQEELKELLIPERAIFSGDGLTTEEDMADWLSATTVKQDVPHVCGWMRPAKKGSTDYHELSMVMTHLKGENRSGPLLRVIRQHKLNHGSLPASCEQVMNSYKGIVGIKTCE